MTSAVAQFWRHPIKSRDRKQLRQVKKGGMIATGDKVEVTS